jgi:hypothetical protein
MVPGDSGVEQTPVAAAGLDPDSAEWLRGLADVGPRREAALARLHEMDTLVIEMASNRNAIYKTMFDARRKLRAALAANGYLSDDCSRRS